MGHEGDKDAIEWQTGVWDCMSDVYFSEVDRRFAPVVAGVLKRAGLVAGDRMLDLGTGTGSVVFGAAAAIGPTGHAVGHDISREMLDIASQRAVELGLDNTEFAEGRAEHIPADDEAFDVVSASLSLMYVIDRKAAASEIARVLRPGGKFVAAVWAGPEECDIVRFQQTAGSFAPPPPVPGVGPGAMADAAEFMDALARCGMRAEVESELLGFEFEEFDAAWDVLAGVTTAKLAPEIRQRARDAVRELMWPEGDGARYFNNKTQFITGILG